MNNKQNLPFLFVALMFPLELHPFPFSLLPKDLSETPLRLLLRHPSIYQVAICHDADSGLGNT